MGNCSQIMVSMVAEKPTLASSHTPNTSESAEFSSSHQEDALKTSSQAPTPSPQFRSDQRSVSIRRSLVDDSPSRYGISLQDVGRRVKIWTKNYVITGSLIEVDQREKRIYLGSAVTTPIVQTSLYSGPSEQRHRAMVALKKITDITFMDHAPVDHSTINNPTRDQSQMTTPTRDQSQVLNEIPASGDTTSESTEPSIGSSDFTSPAGQSDSARSVQASEQPDNSDWSVNTGASILSPNGELFPNVIISEIRGMRFEAVTPVPVERTTSNPESSVVASTEVPQATTGKPMPTVISMPTVTTMPTVTRQLKYECHYNDGFEPSGGINITSQASHTSDTTGAENSLPNQDLTTVRGPLQISQHQSDTEPPTGFDSSNSRHMNNTVNTMGSESLLNTPNSEGGDESSREVPESNANGRTLSVHSVNASGFDLASGHPSVDHLGTPRESASSDRPNVTF